MLKLCLPLPWLIELCVNNWKYNVLWGFCHFILSCDSYFVKSRTKVKTNLHIAVLKKLKSSTAKTITSNDVFSPSWYKNQVTKKLWLMYRLCKVFIDQRSNSSLHRITWNAFRKLIIFIKISYTSAIFFFFSLLLTPLQKHTRLPKLRAGEQGLCFNSLLQLGRSGEVKERKNPKVKFDQQSGE